MSQMLSVGNMPSLYSNLFAFDDRSYSFFSGFGYISHMDEITKLLNKKDTDVYCRGRYRKTGSNGYETKVSRLPNSDYAHIVAFKKDAIRKNEVTGEETITDYLYYTSEEPFKMIDASKDLTLVDKVYDKLYKSPLPIIKEWVPYLIDQMATYHMLKRMDVYDMNETDDKPSTFRAFSIQITVSQLKSLIHNGLQQKFIVVSENANEVSETMRDIAGLDSYLNHFRDTLARRIQDSFVPRFIPGTDKFSQTMEDIRDYESYMGGKTPFEAQCGVIQATSNALDHKKTAFIIGEQGSGKTLMSITTALVHNRDQKVMTNIVMCPGHLVEKWAREIRTLAPLSDVEIITDFDALTSLMPKIKDSSRKRHLWLVMSKETAKFGYQERPAVILKRSTGHANGEDHAVYCCPECGKPLYSLTYHGRGRYRYATKHYFTSDTFGHKNKTNDRCMNRVSVWDSEKNEYIEKPCGAKLWTAIGKYHKPADMESRPDQANWVNIGSHYGWIERDQIQGEIDRINNMTTIKREDAAKLMELSAAVDGDIPPQRAPIKYPLGKYIRKNLKGYIDYAFADEVHELKAKDSLQGQAFGDLIATAKHSLCFTGTLLNGYAAGIFYILYRCFPDLMKKEGFEFSGAGEEQFTKEYGVYRHTQWFEMTDGRQGNRTGSSQTKSLPGISPIVFTKFLLENAAFISLEDIGAGLPGYEEIPVPVDMDPELRGAYNTMENTIHDLMSGSGRDARSGGRRVMSQMINTLTIYPDQPYEQPPVLHPDTGAQILQPQELNKDTVRNKETELLRIVSEKVEAGEKVLVYYHWTNRTNLAKRLTKMFGDNDIKAVAMPSSVKNSSRESWINDQINNKGVQVLICNPSLVETGLDLLDFTTIIFYQVGYNLFTMRQASRRSWRLSQEKDVQVYFLFYRGTVQEQALSLMATKLEAAMAIEGKFSEEGLNAMSNNEDILTQIAASVADGIKDTVDAQVFSSGKVESTKISRKEDTRMINITRQHPVSLLDQYRETRAKSKKRVIADKACSAPEMELLNNPSLLFAAI